MNINELKNIEMNNAVAYILGTIYPLTKSINYNNYLYFAGQINHQSNMITDNELLEHFQEIYKLLEQNSLTNVLILDNLEEKISRKKGFSILLKNDNQDENELSLLIQNIKNSNLDIQKYFLIGCFDGRSSYDTSSKYLSVDVDRDYDKQNNIKEILLNFGIEPNINNRDINHPKNDQIRIPRKYLDDFINKIGLFSVRRKTILLNRNK